MKKEEKFYVVVGAEGEFVGSGRSIESAIDVVRLKGGNPEDLEQHLTLPGQPKKAGDIYSCHECTRRFYYHRNESPYFILDENGVWITSDEALEVNH